MYMYYGIIIINEKNDFFYFLKKKIYKNGEFVLV